MTAPATMKELPAKMETPWAFMVELKTYSEETRKQVNLWTRQLVNAGNAIRFNQKWPGCKTEAEGKTLILTTSLAEAHHTKKPLRFGKLDYTIAYIRGEKYGTVYAVHKGEAAGYSEAERKAIFTAIHRRATLAEYTQHVGTQTFEYHEQAQQYLISTPLSAKATKVFEEALKGLQAGLLCIDCKKFTAKLQPCPYESDINGDYTEQALCDKCADRRADEV